MRAGLGYVSTIVSAYAQANAPAAVFTGHRTDSVQLLDQAARTAGGLRALGLRPGDRVAVLSPNSDLFMALYLAIPWAGGVIAPLNARWSAAENAYALDDCTPSVAFVAGPVDDTTAAIFEARAHRITVVSLDDAARPGWMPLSDLLAAEPTADAGRAGDDLLGIFYTGGTTGRPKGVMISHRALLQNCMAMRELGVFPDGCRALIVAPLFHLAAIAALTMTMLAGGAAIIAPSFDPAKTLDLIANESVTDALLVPTMIQMVLDAPGFNAVKLASVRTILYGASPIPEATLVRIMDAAPHVDFVQAYGMTEVSCTATILSPEFHRGAHRAAGRHRGAGQPIPHTELKIVDADGVQLPIGEVGEVLVRGPGVMLGYWNQPEQTANAVRDGWMHTGDGGRLDDLGILYVVDRLKDMIVSGGENVYSAEVEGALAKHLDVAQCAVIGVPDARWGERVHAVIVARSGSNPSPEGIIEHCRALIAGYKCPRSVELRNTPLPMSAAGKILKSELRAPYWAEQDRNVS